MDTHDHYSLTSDIQRALNDAVSQANHGYAESPSADVRVKKKSHKRDHSEVVDGEHKKKRKAHEDINISAEPQADGVDGERRKKKKSKKRAKDKESAQSLDSAAPSSHHAQSGALSTSLSCGPESLSQVIASAEGPSQTHSRVSPQFPQHDPYTVHQDIQHPQYMYPAPITYGIVSESYPQDPPGLSSMDVPLPDFTHSSNEDILRAIQDLDLSKIAGVIKSLGEAAVAVNGSTFIRTPEFEAGQPSQASRVTVVAQDSSDNPKAKARSVKSKRTLDMSLPGVEQFTNEDHAQMLASQWLTPSKLKELVKTEGLFYRKGKFSAIEEHQVKTAIEQYQQQRQLTDEQLRQLIFDKTDKSKDHTFWAEITSAVPLRPIVAVYHHVRRIYHPMKGQGEWKFEEDAKLLAAVTDLGQRWEKVSTRVGRMASDCRDRYRNHIANREARVTGPWTKEEEEELTQIVSEMTVQQGKDTDNDVFWGRVSERMGGRRGRQQCRIKWTDALSKTVKNEGHKPRWSQLDGYILVHKVDSLNVRDDTEIDWKTLPDDGWNLWSAHCLQRRWLTLKRSVKGYEDMTHREIMDILRMKKSQPPPPPSPPSTTKKRRARVATGSAPAGPSRGRRNVISSKEVIDDSGDDE